MPPKKPPIMPEYLITRNHFYFDGSPMDAPLDVMVRILRIMGVKVATGSKSVFPFDESQLQKQMDQCFVKFLMDVYMLTTGVRYKQKSSKRELWYICPNCHSIVGFQVKSEEFVESCDFFRVGESGSVQNAKVDFETVCYVMQDFIILHLQYLYGKPFFLNDNYKEVKQKFAAEFGYKASFPRMTKKIRSVLKDNTTYYHKERNGVFDRLKFSGATNPVVLYSNIRKQHSLLAKVQYSDKEVGDVLVRNKNNRYEMAHIGAMIPLCEFCASSHDESDEDAIIGYHCAGVTCGPHFICVECFRNMVKSTEAGIYDMFPKIWRGVKRNNFQSYEDYDINPILGLKLGKKWRCAQNVEYKITHFDVLTKVGQLVKRFCAPPSCFVVDVSGVPDLGEPEEGLSLMQFLSRRWEVAFECCKERILFCNNVVQLCNDNTTSEEKKVDLISVEVSNKFPYDAIEMGTINYSPLEERIEFDENVIDFDP